MSDSERDSDEKEARWFNPGELNEADAEELPPGQCCGCGYEETDSETKSPEPDGGRDPTLDSGDLVDRADADWQRVMSFVDAMPDGWDQTMAGLWPKVAELEWRIGQLTMELGELRQKIEKEHPKPTPITDVI